MLTLRLRDRVIQSGVTVFLIVKIVCRNSRDPILGQRLTQSWVVIQDSFGRPQMLNGYFEGDIQGWPTFLFFRERVYWLMVCARLTGQVAGLR